MPSRFAARLWLFVFFAASIVISIPGSAAQEAKPKLSTLPLAFERNDGQTQSPYRFLVRRGASGTFFLADGMDVVVPQRKGEETRVRVRWVGSDPGAEISGTDRLPGYSNYLRGSEPSRWLRDVPQFAQVRYGNIYPGIDLLFHGNAESLEHDFILKPGADPSHISLRFDKAVRLAADGNLTVDLGETKIHFLRPQAYQESGGTRNGVPARFLIARNGDVHFKLGKYDHNKTLVIDPVFSFSTYLDGANADSITAVTTDSAGDVYVTGFTASSDFPITNAANPLCAQCSDASQTSEAFISKLDPTGHSLLFSTFLGGSTMGGAFGTFAGAIALDHNGNIIVAGASSSSDFPHAGAVLSLSPQSANSTFYFIASLKPDGSAFNYAGLVGGSQGSYTNGNNGKLAVDAAGNAYLSGTEDDANFQLTSGVLGPTPTTAGFDSMFVMKFDSAGKLVYSTLVPGTLPQDPTKVTQNSFLATGITVDSAGDVTIAGNGGPGLPVTPGALLSAIPNAATYVDPTAGLLLQLDPTASALNFATYLPGVDVAGGLAVDSVGNFYVTGVTSETTLPVGPSSYQKAIVPNADCTCNAGFVMKINPLAKSVLAATYLSGSSGASFRGIAVDSKSNVFVGGFAFGGDFPLKNPFVTRYQISSTIADTVVAQLDTNLTTLQFGSYLSGSSNPYPGSIFAALAIDPNDKPVVVGTTFATDYPTTAGSFQTAPPPSSNPLSSYQHTFISKLDLATPAPSVCLPVGAVNFPTAGVNTSESQTLTVTNCGNAPLQISTVTSSLPVVTAAQSCGSVAPGGNCNVQLTFTPVDTSVSQGTISLKDNAAITQQTIAFSGQGGLPNVIFPSAYQTADLLVGTRGESFLTLLNQGDANWVIKSITVTGDFTVDSSFCASPVPPINSGTSFCTIGIIFAPTLPGQRSGTLTIVDNIAGSPHVTAITGNGFTIYPSPSISAILAVPTDTQHPTATIFGTNFFPESQFSVNGSPRTTRYGGEEFLLADLTAADLAQAGELTVTVSNPSPGGGVSNSFPATIYVAIRDIGILHAVVEPKSGLLYASVSAQSANYANQVIVIDPVAAKVKTSFSVGNGPNQLAVSDDGQFLYVGLDGDKKVTQLSLPAGTINFTVGLGTDPDFHNPMVADEIRVLPGQPHAWVATLCGVGFVPCGEGVAVFDDAVVRPTEFLQNQAQPDSLLFIGNNATTLFGTTLQQLPSTLYEFSINSSGIMESQAVTNFSGASPGGGILDTDGTSIYVGNGQVINPSTFAITSNIGGLPYNPGMRVDPPSSRVYFAGGTNFLFPLGQTSDIDAFDLTGQHLLGTLPLQESVSGASVPDVLRWGNNGLLISSSNGALLFRTSLTSNAIATTQFFVSGLSPATVPAGGADLPVVVTGGGFAVGDSLIANGELLNLSGVSSSQFTVTVPAALLSDAGDVQIAVSDSAGHVGNLVLVVTPSPTSVALSTNFLAFNSQVLNTASGSQTVTISNTGNGSIQVSSIMASGDFSQTNSCTAIAAGASCSVTVVFKPTATGNRSGFLTINDSDVTKSQSVALSGTGGDIQIGAASNSSTSQTAAAGQTATYDLMVGPVGAVTAMTTFSCSNLPVYASCQITPQNADLSKGTANVTVTISTSQAVALVRPAGAKFVAAAVWPLLVISLPFVSLGMRRDRRKKWSVMLLALALICVPMSGCGGAGTSAPPPPAATVTPQGTYQVSFVATSPQGTKSIPLTLVVD